MAIYSQLKINCNEFGIVRTRQCKPKYQHQGNLEFRMSYDAMKSDEVIM